MLRKNTGKPSLLSPMREEVTSVSISIYENQHRV
jgi:hypothetical protein